MALRWLRSVIAMMALSISSYISADDSAQIQNEINIIESSAKAPKTRNLYLGVKSNMLMDILAVPSIGVEYMPCRNISVGAEWMYAWWSRERSHRYWRLYGGDVIVRYWLSKSADTNRLSGHHLGIYGGVFTFDFEWGGKAYMGGKPGKNLWNRCMINAGIEYGYSLPIARRFNIDFTIGVGYIGGVIEKFSPNDGYLLWESTSRHTWIGPTKAEISLVWLIGSSNYNARKGGMR